LIWPGADTSEEVLRAVVDPAFNLAFGVEVGYRGFELVAEDWPANMRFCARSIRLEVHREPRQ